MELPYRVINRIYICMCAITLLLSLKSTLFKSNSGDDIAEQIKGEAFNPLETENMSQTIKYITFRPARVSAHKKHRCLKVAENYELSSSFTRRTLWSLLVPRQYPNNIHKMMSYITAELQQNGSNFSPFHTFSDFPSFIFQVDEISHSKWNVKILRLRRWR